MPRYEKNNFAAILFLTCVTLSAQNTIPNQYSQFGGSASGMDGNRYDRNGNPIDTTAVIDANTIPIGLFSWKIDERLGNIFETPVDTIQHAFQNTNDTGGPTGHYTYLGNLGAPRISHVFFERKETSQFFFTDPYDLQYDVRKTLFIPTPNLPLRTLLITSKETDDMEKNDSRPILLSMSTNGWASGLI